MRIAGRILLGGLAIGLALTAGEARGQSEEQGATRMEDQDQWPDPRGELLHRGSGATYVNPFGLPTPDGPAQHFVLQRPELPDWGRQAKVTLKIPPGQVGFFNAGSSSAVFALTVDGARQANISLGPEELVTVSCGRCDQDAWAAIATDGKPDTNKVRLSSRSMFSIVVEAGAWKFVPTTLLNISYPVPSDGGSVWTSR